MRWAERPPAKRASITGDSGHTGWFVPVGPGGHRAGFESKSAGEPVGGMAGFEAALHRSKSSHSLACKTIENYKADDEQTGRRLMLLVIEDGRGGEIESRTSWTEQRALARLRYAPNQDPSLPPAAPNSNGLF